LNKPIAFRPQRSPVLSPDGATLTLFEAHATHAPSQIAESAGPTARPPLVLIHGTTDTHGSFDALAHALLTCDGLTHDSKNRFRIFTFDRRGRGASGDGSDYSLAREYEDIKAIVERVAFECSHRVTLVAHSYGAICALGGSQTTPVVEKLVAYEPPLPTGFDADYQEALHAAEALWKQRADEALVELFFRRVVKLPQRVIQGMRHLPGWTDRVASAATLIREMRAVTTANPVVTAEDFAGLQCPTLLLEGSHSPAFLIRATDHLYSVLPHAQRLRLDGQRHGAFMQAPQRVVEMMAPFLRAHTSPAQQPRRA